MPLRARQGACFTFGKKGIKMSTQSYQIFVEGTPQSDLQQIGVLILNVPKGDDGYWTDCLVEELIEAINKDYVRDCHWTAKEIKDSNAPCGFGKK